MTQTDIEPKGISRRDVLRRGAAVGGALLWVAPAIQTLPRSALAHSVGSPMFTCCECRPGTPNQATPTCTGGNANDRVCSTMPTTQAACITFCADQGKAWCFHSAPASIACAGSSGLCAGHD